MGSEKVVTRIAMAKRVAQAWLQKEATPEYRLAVYSGTDLIRDIPGLLRKFRNGKAKIAGLQEMTDLGIKPEFDKITFKSRDKSALESLDTWLISKGCETSGVW